MSSKADWKCQNKELVNKYRNWYIHKIKNYSKMKINSPLICQYGWFLNHYPESKKVDTKRVHMSYFI